MGTQAGMKGQRDVPTASSSTGDRQGIGLLRRTSLTRICQNGGTQGLAPAPMEDEACP